MVGLPKNKSSYLFTRFLARAYFRAGEHFSAFAQLQSGAAIGMTATAPVDKNPLEL